MVSTLGIESKDYLWCGVVVRTKWEDLSGTLEQVTVVRGTPWELTVSALLHSYAYCLSQDPS